jgi:hypothetical protein
MHMFRFSREPEHTEITVMAETLEEAVLEFLEQQGWVIDEEDEENGGWID